MSEIELMRLATEANDRSKSNSHRIEDLEKRQDNLDNIVKTVALIANEQEHIKCDLSEIKHGLKALADKPAKRWDSLIDKIVMVLVGAVLAYMLTQIGM